LGLAEPGVLVASEPIINAVAHAGTVLELRLECADPGCWWRWRTRT
jgi:hypothetical protein